MDEGGRVLSFQEKRKNQRKADWLFSRLSILVQAFRKLYTGSCPTFLRGLFRPEPAAFAVSLFAAHASYNLYSFRDSANGVFLFRQVSPAPCSPPLGGSGAGSAVRFTPAGKYGGRENWPSGRDTGCMSGHPCRAHHKLKWARKLGRCTRASVFAFSTLREQQNNNRSNAPLPSSASPPAQTPTGQPCLTGVGNNPLIVIKHHQCAVSRMPQARRSRLSLTRCAGGAALLRKYLSRVEP